MAVTLPVPILKPSKKIPGKNNANPWANFCLNDCASACSMCCSMCDGATTAKVIIVFVINKGLLVLYDYQRSI